MKEIVIKIPDEVLSFVYQNGFIKEEDRNTVHHAVLECVELPKGHGRLIDESKIDWLGENDDRFTTINRLKNSSPTLVEADKGEE